MQTEMSTKYNPKEIEDKWYSFWENEGIFHSEPDLSKKPYSIVIPPPNVTGVLHIGHALNNIIQDILIRWRRMQGYNTLWMPGTDHAGIATQNVVERELASKGVSKDLIGRAEFIKRVWEWKDKYGSTIIKQLKKLGSSCDWERERFTMDQGLSEAVKETFAILYKRNLIYKGKYVINWCPRCRTALADDEVEHEEREGNLWFIKYPFHDAPHLHVTVATTRPETMLGDVAVAVNPADKRYNEMIGDVLVLPIVERKISIIADNFVDAEFGTGAVKVTPAHDINDFEMSLRHNLEPITVMNDDATMNANAGDYVGMDRFECREAIIEELKLKELIAKVEPYIHSVGHCYRCYTVIEPYLSDQWFIKMKPLAQAALKATEDGSVKFYPERWTAVYSAWLNNVRDWCISRQIWWGHRIPAWYCEDCNKINVHTNQPERCARCKGSRLKQDDDVLDTWFSSSLWPFSTMGWPEKTKELGYYYPTSTLVTDRGIIYFWVARMVMMGLEIMGNEPFRDVYIHGTILDEIGRKMSKSLGNGIDPLEMIDQYGADAVRVSLILLTTEGQDIKLSESKFEMGRNFSNKLWNAARFSLMNLDTVCDESKVFAEETDYSPAGQDIGLMFEDKWILSRLNSAIEDSTSLLEVYRFNEALRKIYEFFWNDFCDWYLEIIKPRLYLKQTMNDQASGVDIDLGSRLTAHGSRLLNTQASAADINPLIPLTEGDGSRKSRLVGQDVLAYTLDKILRLLHPFVPFITEDIWQRLKGCGQRHRHCVSKGLENNMDYKSIMVASWPAQRPEFSDKVIECEMELLQGIVRAIRNIRNKMNIHEKQPLEAFIMVSEENDANIFIKRKTFLKQMTNLDGITISPNIAKPESAVSEVVGNAQIFVPLSGLIDVKIEKERQQKRLMELERHINIIKNKLNNNAFLQKAPEDIVMRERKRKEDLAEQIVKVKQILKDLGG